jgi:membrane protease YdiL (CAAX protease family)
LFVTAALGALFAWAAYKQFTSGKDDYAVSFDLLIGSSVIELMLVTFLLGFLAARRKSFAAIFGFRALPPLQVLGRAALFLVAALPGVLGLAIVTGYFNPEPEEQQIVMFFRDQVKHGDYRAVVAVFITAAVVAPVVEELFFRGFFYPTLKRYLGPAVAALLVSALFALVHANVSSMLGLFGLALCLTVAYEWSGSLLVSMAMHSFFNTLSLLVMGWQMTHSTP